MYPFPLTHALHFTFQEEIGEVDEDDRKLYSDELCNIACLARQALPHAVSVLIEKIEQRVALMRHILEQQILKQSHQGRSEYTIIRQNVLLV